MGPKRPPSRNHSDARAACEFKLGRQELRHALHYRDDVRLSTGNEDPRLRALPDRKEVSLNSGLAWKREAEKIAPSRYRHVLHSPDGVGHGRGIDSLACVEMPERPASGRVDSFE